MMNIEFMIEEEIYEPEMEVFVGRYEYHTYGNKVETSLLDAHSMCWFASRRSRRIANGPETRSLYGKELVGRVCGTLDLQDTYEVMQYLKGCIRKLRPKYHLPIRFSRRYK